MRPWDLVGFHTAALFIGTGWWGILWYKGILAVTHEMILQPREGLQGGTIAHRLFLNGLGHSRSNFFRR